MADDADLAQARDEQLMALHWKQRAAIKQPESSGWCVACGDSIDPRRLAALPYAKRCFECQRRYECHD